MADKDLDSIAPGLSSVVGLLGICLPWFETVLWIVASIFSSCRTWAAKSVMTSIFFLNGKDYSLKNMMGSMQTLVNQGLDSTIVKELSLLGLISKASQVQGTTSLVGCRGLSQLRSHKSSSLKSLELSSKRVNNIDLPCVLTQVIVELASCCLEYWSPVELFTQVWFNGYGHRPQSLLQKILVLGAK